MSRSTNISLPVSKHIHSQSRAHIDSSILQELTSIIDGDVRIDRHDRMLYSTDASLYQVEPIGIVCPKHTNDVEATVQFCRDKKLPILPRGAGTSLAGQAVNHAVIIDCSAYCNRILDIDIENRIAHVEPGVVLDRLNSELSTHGLMFGPDVATSAQANVGGMIGNNSSGAHSVVYGRTVEHLVALDVICADGARMRLKKRAAENDSRVQEIQTQITGITQRVEKHIDEKFPKIVRRVNGYNLDLILKQMRDLERENSDGINLSHLVCGSEGTLAVIVGAWLNLVDAPTSTGLAMIAFTELDEALRAVPEILETNPAAVELIDDMVIEVAKLNLECRRFVDNLPKLPNGKTGAVLYIEYFGDSENHLSNCFYQLQNRFRNHEVKQFTDSVARANAWKLRKAGEPLLHAIPGLRKPLTFIEDTAVAPERVAAFVREFKELVARHGTSAAFYAHASVGCLHIRPLLDIRNESDRNAMKAIAEEATDLVRRYEGALSGEHGDGRARSHLLERFYGPEICEAFREVKKVFDPENLLNPGNIVSHIPMTEQLRMKPHDSFIRPSSVNTFFRYGKDDGFDEAVHRCNGAGMCRKMSGGTMCPSYRATRDERHATRGRGNALRLAISGQFSHDGESPNWTDPATHETLDLCLSCKACKSECPSNVDIAKLKSEYLAQGFRRRGRVPFRTQLFGRVRVANRIGSVCRHVVNPLLAFPPTRLLVSRLLGIHHKRILPAFRQSLFRQVKDRVRTNNSERPVVVLFPDCFTTYIEPDIGKSAITVLEACGYRVVIPVVGCCGRSLISNGMLEEAIYACATTAHALDKCVDQSNAVAIVCCEPSCASAIKDDWVDLDMDVNEETVQRLKNKTFLVEEFIEEAWDRHPCKPQFRSNDAQDIVLHAHCHQKALWGFESSSRLLQRIAGSELKVLDSGCCGMAGAFGYMKDHFDLSMKIGELSLFQSVRENPEATLIAPGTSCRQQIADGLHRTTIHPIEYVARCLKIAK